LFGKRYENLGKPVFAKKMVDCGFSIENAAKHTQCQSAKIFYNYLKELNNKNKI